MMVVTSEAGAEKDRTADRSKRNEMNNDIKAGARRDQRSAFVRTEGFVNQCVNIL